MGLGPEARLWFDYEGRPISSQDWARLYVEDARYLIRETAAGCELVTAWLGTTYEYPIPEHPLIYGTCIFWGDSSQVPSPPSREVERYATREEALAGHARWLSALMRGEVEPPADDHD